MASAKTYWQQRSLRSWPTSLSLGARLNAEHSVAKLTKHVNCHGSAQLIARLIARFGQFLVSAAAAAHRSAIYH